MSCLTTRTPLAKTFRNLTGLVYDKSELTKMLFLIWNMGASATHTTASGTLGRLLRGIVATIVITGLVFGVTGRWDLPRLRAYVAACSALASGGTASRSATS